MDFVHLEPLAYHAFMASRNNARKLPKGCHHAFVATVREPYRTSKLFRNTNLIFGEDVIHDLLTTGHEEEPGREPVLKWARLEIEKNAGNRIRCDDGKVRSVVSVIRLTREGGLTAAEVEEMRKEFYRDFDHKSFVLLDRPRGMQLDPNDDT